jgi:hypothetical protein
VTPPVRWRPAIAALLAIAALATSAAPASRPAAAEAPENKQLYVVTDSVGLGAERAIPAAFPGWDVTLDGDAGEFTETMARKYVAPRAATGQLGDYALVATGYNYPYWDPERFDRSIDEMIATLVSGGVRHVLWVTLREVKPQYITAAAWRQVQPYYWYFPTVNDHLERALERHPNLSLVDWAAVADQPGLTYDAIHLNPTGAALYASIVRQAVIDVTTAAPGGSVIVVPVPDAAGVGAVAVNLTTTAPRTGGFLTAYPCGTPTPPISTHNYGRAQVVAHAAIVPLGDDATFCVFTPTATNVIVDITGRFAAAAIESTVSTRLADTRAGAAPQPAMTPLVVNVGAGTAVAALGVTAVDAAAPGWVKAAPCDSADTTSTVNMVDSSPVPNVAVVAPDADGSICVTASVATHLIVDRLTTLAADPDVELGSPRRLIDTRDDAGVPVAAGSTLVLDGETLGTTADSGGVMLNLTATDPVAGGFLTAFPCAGGTPTTSSLNYAPGVVTANFAVVEPDADGDVCVFTLSATHIVVDLLGTLGSSFTGGTPQRLLDTRTGNLPPGWP